MIMDNIINIAVADRPINKPVDTIHNTCTCISYNYSIVFTI